MEEKRIKSARAKGNMTFDLFPSKPIIILTIPWTSLKIERVQPFYDEQA